MELELSRVDYTVVGVTNPDCLKILPPSLPKEQQRVIVADTDGILQVFSIRKEDVVLHFKTLPGRPITSVQIAGAIGTVNDKIFVASETEVRGYTKKGKLFLTFDSGMTEIITSMYVLGNDLFLCGKHVYNHYRDCKDVGSYLCGDRIVDVIAFFMKKTKRQMSLIACEGRVIRAIEHARVTFTMEVESSPTLLHIYENEEIRCILFGTIDGRVGIINVETNMGFDSWILSNVKNSASISCMDSYDLTGNGMKNLIIGREDGNIEVYEVVFLDDKIQLEAMIFSNNFNESITSVKCGVVGLQPYDEIVICTYTGRILGLTTQTIDGSVDVVDGNYMFSGDVSNKISKLRNEIDVLQHKVMKEREKYQSSTMSFFDELSAIPLLSVKCSFILSKETATYTLTMEVPTAIDNILLQSATPLYLLDVEKNSAVVSYSDSDPTNGNFLLATYRCQINTNRLELIVRTIEGQKGQLLTYVTPLVQPKCSRLMKFDIKCLSMHFRIHNFDESRPLNTLTIKGSFSLAEIHNWVIQCLPEVPEKPQVNERNILWFQSSLVGTILQCSYQKGEAAFKTDNVSTISILKDFISSAATKKKIKVDVNSIINDESINHTLKLIHPKLLELQDSSKQIALIDALAELEISNEETSSYLCDKYKNLIHNEKELRRKLYSQPGFLDRMYGTINDLYVDYNKFKGNNVKSKTANLLECLQNYTYDSLVRFFRPDVYT